MEFLPDFDTRSGDLNSAPRFQYRRWKQFRYPHIQCCISLNSFELSIFFVLQRWHRAGVMAVRESVLFSLFYPNLTRILFILYFSRHLKLHWFPSTIIPYRWTYTVTHEIRRIHDNICTGYHVKRIYQDCIKLNKTIKLIPLILSEKWSLLFEQNSIHFMSIRYPMFRNKIGCWDGSSINDRKCVALKVCRLGGKELPIENY